MKKKLQKNINEILQSTERARFMTSSLWNLVNNLFEKIYKIKCKYRDDDKKCKYFLWMHKFKDDLTE